MNINEKQLLTRVSWLYYMEELTQKEIGERLGLSRIKINRLLNQARQEGIVEIKIHGATTHANLEHKLCEAYGLRDAVVISSANDRDVSYRTLAEAVSSWLSMRLEDGISIGISIGRTVSHLPESFVVNQPVDCTFVEMMGGAASHMGSFEQYNVVSRMSEIAGGRASYFYAPTIVSSSETRDSLLKEKTVKDALEKARSCQISIQSAGSIVDGALLRKYGYVSDDELTALSNRGAVGDVLCHYIDAEGKPVESSIDDRLMSITLDDLKSIPWRVGVGGFDKLKVLHAALRGKLFNVLITDEQTAKELIAMSQ